MRHLPFNGSRLITARERRAVTKVSLSAALSIPQANLNRLEQNTLVPEPKLVTAISTKLLFPESFFFGDDLEEPPSEGAHFRAPSKMTKRNNRQIHSVTSIGLLLYKWLADRFVLPEVDIPSFEPYEPELAADAVRREWGIGCTPVHSIVPLLESRGAIVFSLPPDCLHIDAFSFWAWGRPFVFLNTTKSAERTRMDVAHELGHLVLHNATRSGSKQNEQEAAEFGSAFLMPSESVIAHLPRAYSLSQIVSAKQVWRVSAAALTVRLHELRLISDSAYRDFFIHISRLGYRKNEPEPCRPEVSQLLRQLMQLLYGKGITVMDVSRKLGLNTMDVSDLMRNLTLIALPPTEDGVGPNVRMSSDGGGSFTIIQNNEFSGSFSQ